MTGQGSPRTSPPVLAFPMRLLGRSWCAALAFGFLWAAAPVGAEEPSFRIRMAWGAGQSRQWRGTIAVDGGTVTEPLALGIEADEPGSIWSERGLTLIEQKSARSYDGCDLTVTAPVGARLTVTLTPADGTRQPVVIEIPTADLISSRHNSPLDEQGNRLLVQRLPGDMLRVRLTGRRGSEAAESLVFWGGDVMRLELTPHLLGVPPGTQLNLTAQLFAAESDDELWTEPQDWVAPADGSSTAPLSLAVPLPVAEGVYELRIAAERGGFRNTIGLSQTVASRKVQFVVLEKNPAAAPLRSQTAPVELELIDPASPSWWDRLTNVPLVPGLRRGPLSGEYAETVDHELGRLVRLPPRDAGREESWEAYPLPIRDPGTPHVLEVDLPTDVAQSIGISIVEPNAAGAVMPIGLDSGVYRSADAVEATARWSKHRLIFWPRTKTPLVLLTNRHPRAEAVFGKIRLLRYEGRLPSAFDTGGARPERLLAGYYARPLFAENFSATESLDRASGRSLDDWVTFYQGARRLVDYLNHTGRNGLMLSVLADGSTIYPSRLLDPTPRYDTGVFFGSAQDPVRKDVLELLFRLFDREGLQLIPALHFSTPLPELQRQQRQGGPQSIGLRWIGADGKSWLETHGTNRGKAPHYNPLNGRVQQAMLGVVRELADRYSHHASYGGVSVVMSADGYAQLPGARWGYDDDTIARYERDLGVRIPGAGPERFSLRDRALSGEQYQQWLQWRAGMLSAFHGLMQAEVTRTKPDAKLYLASADSLAGHDSQRALRPVLPRTVSVPHALLEVGIDPARYADRNNIVLSRPVSIAPLDSLYGDSARAVDLAISQAANVDARFAASGTTAGLFYHPPQQSRLESFEAKSPYRPTYSWQVAQLSPAGIENRKRFVRAIATMDAQAIFDGGWLLPLGQEEELAELVEVFRRLPGGRFETIEAATQPVTIRTLKRDNRTYVYMVNDSPWPAIVECGVAGPMGLGMESLSSRRLSPPTRGRGPAADWTIRLEPYDLVGCRFHAGDVALVEPRVRLAQPDVVDRLANRIKDLWNRAAVLREDRPLAGLENGGFEAPLGRLNEVPDWKVVAQGQGSPEVSVEAYQPYSGSKSVRFLSDGRIASFWSTTFKPPRTGRISISVWLRTPDPTRQPRLRLAVEGQTAGTSYYRHAKVGAGSGNNIIRPEWNQFIFQVPDLPLEGLSDLRVRFDLMGPDPGEVWIDKVEIFESSFALEELKELGSIIALAGDYLERGRVRDAYHVLQGYWPRFLSDRVTFVPAPLAERGESPPGLNDAARQAPAAAPGFIQGLRNRLLPKFLR